MDLQTILDQSDSSDDGIGINGSVDVSLSSSHMDLEQILREDDEEDDHNASSMLGKWENFSYDSPSVKDAEVPHNSEEWALLQSILGERDGAIVDDDISNASSTSVGELPWLDPSTKVAKLTEDRVHLEALLKSPDDTSFGSDESDVEFSLPPSISNLYFDDRPKVDTSQIKSSDSPERTSSRKSPDLVIQHSVSFENTDKNGKAVDETSSEDITRRALTYAQACERKLLKAGRREIVSPLMVKRRLRPKVEMVARGQKKKSTLSDRLATSPVARFNFSGIVEGKEMATISTQIVKHSGKEAKVLCGLPTSFACNSKFIAMGTQVGIILVFDLFEVLRQRLGGGGFEDNWNARKAGAVTSLDLSSNGEMIVSGYSSGLIVLWDTIRGTVLRSMNDTHPSPVTSIRFTGDSKAVSCDAGGLVNMLTFVRGILWSSYSVETDCLLDGTAGQILAMDVLPSINSVSRQVRCEEVTSHMKGISLIALTSERSSFVIAVDPSVSVLHRWGRPSQELVDNLNTSLELPSERVDLPCLAWGWALVSGGRNVATPILARAWGCCLQFLGASFPSGNNAAKQVGEKVTDEAVDWPGFGVRDEIDGGAPIVAIAWLNSRSLMYLTVTNEFHLVDTVMMTLVERLDFSGVKLVYAEFALSRSIKDEETPQQEVSRAAGITFQNSMRYNDDRLLVLCQDALNSFSILGAKSRVAALEDDGEWLEALALALDHYDSTITSQEDRRRNPLKRKNLSAHPEFSLPKSDDEEWIAKLLIRYINLAVENAPEQRTNQIPASSKGRVDLVQSHYQMLAGVCVEFCVVTRRLDLLYGPIFNTFQQIGFVAVFLDVLEPYVLNDKLTYMAPEIMSQFVERCKAADDIATVERCLLHMDCTVMDFDSILSLLRTNEMYTALFYVFNQGLDDFVTPFEILLESVFDEADTGSPVLQRQRNGAPQNDFERYGYKAILYLQMSFKGLSFPLEEEQIEESRQPTVMQELMAFLIQAAYEPSTHAKRAGDRMFTIGTRANPYPYLSLLLQVDALGVFQTLSLSFDSPHFLLESQVSADSDIEWTRDSGQVTKIQTSVDALVRILLPADSATQGDDVVGFHSKYALSLFFDFVAKYLMAGTVMLENRITFMVLERCAELYSKASTLEDRYQRQRRVLDLLGALPGESYDPDDVLSLIKQYSIHRAALLLHQQVASVWNSNSAVDDNTRYEHFKYAIDCYLEDDDVSFRRDVFNYVKKECAGSSLPQHTDQPKTLRDALREKLPDLVRLDAEMAVRLVADLFVDDFDEIVDSLDVGDDGSTQFIFLRAIISGKLGETDPAAISVLPVTMDHHHTYLELMVLHHPSLVYEYLSTHDNYRASDALGLCQTHEIADASAYLLERMGNVSSALQLILQTLESRMMSLKRTIRGMSVDVFRQRRLAHYSQQQNTEGLSKQKKEVSEVKRILVVALDVCSRNSGTSTTRSEQGSQLWFNVLDRLINAKGFLRLSKEQPEHAKEMSNVLSDLLRMTMQRMVSSVPLTDLVRKVTSDHSGSQLSELREMLDSLLGTYGFELKLSMEAHRALLDDLRNMKKQSIDLHERGSVVNSVTNVAITSAPEVSNLLRQAGNGNSALSIQGNGKASFVDMGQLSYSKLAANRLGSALTRLQNRRAGTARKCTGGLTMMNKTERRYMKGEVDPVIYEDRQVGVLGEAENRGSLI